MCCHAGCGAELQKPLVCGRCRTAAYCCKDCQVKDWKAGHKQACAQSKEKAPPEDGAKTFLRQPSGQGGVFASGLEHNTLLEACANGKMDMVDKLLEEGVSQMKMARRR